MTTTAIAILVGAVFLLGVAWRETLDFLWRFMGAPMTGRVTTAEFDILQSRVDTLRGEHNDLRKALDAHVAEDVKFRRAVLKVFEAMEEEN